MQDFFVNLNRYLARRKTLFIVLLVLLLGVTGYIASGIKLEENLNAIIPEDQRVSKISALFNKSELADQIVFILSHSDTTRIDPDQLIQMAELLVDELEKEKQLVRRISYKMGNDAMMGIYDFIYDNLPLFLNESDYTEIKGLLSREEIENTIQNDFKSLISPAGLATRKFILKDPLNLTPLALKKLNQFQLDDNFTLYNSAIFTTDKKHLLFFLDPAYPSSNTQENLKLIEYIDKTVEALAHDSEGTSIEYYGGTAVAVANSVRVKKDIVLTVSIALVFFLMVFLAFFRRLKVIVLMFVPVIIGAGISIAMLTLLYGKVSAIALGVGVIFIGITVDYSLHLFTHMRTGGGLSETLRRISTPVLMSSLTTASAFLCLSVIHSEAMNQIGIFAAFAVVISALSLLIVIPLFLSKNDIFRRMKGSGETSLLEKAVGYRFDKSKILVGMIFLLTFLFAFTSQKIIFNGDISTLNYLSDKLARSEAQLRSISSVANSSVYLVTQGQTLEDALYKLESNQSLFEEIREEGLVTEISWVSELMLSTSAQESRIRKWHQFWDEAGRESLKNTILQSGYKYHFKDHAFDPFYNLLDKEFEPIPMSAYDPLVDLFLDNYIAFEEGTCSLVSILKVEPSDKEELFTRVAASDDFIIFDNQYFINQFFEVLKEDFNKLVIISMIVVFLILLLFFGRIEIALITFIPIIISWLWTLGLMGLFKIEINIFNIIISTFIFGLGIDYCIFIMNGIMANYREGSHSLVPYKLSILLSALTTITGIGVLIFARHPALKSIAIVSIFGISTVVIMSYTLLPLFFSFLTTSRGIRRMEPVSLLSILATLTYFLLFLGCALVVTLILPFFFILPVRKKVKKLIISQIIYLFSRFIVGIGFIIKKRYINRDLLDFGHPSVIISNHQSQLDLVLLLMLHPKMIVLVNKWVWNSPFYGPIIRFADFYPIYKGLDHNFDKIQRKVSEGYSILAFPEASRSPDGKIKRFHQGAFGIADMLGLDIQPILIHGAFDCLPKTELFLKTGSITLKCYPRIKARSVDYEGTRTYRAQAKEVTRFYREEYSMLAEQLGTTDYFRGKLIGHYIYKGPVLEWYSRLKLRFEKNYGFYHQVVPRKCSVVDLGCGYGFLSIMLGMTSGERNITGLDYDGGKIAVAANIVRDLDHIRFAEMDITTGSIPQGDIYILNDVLHYLPEELQLKLLGHCMDSIPEGGMVIMRDADTQLKKRTLYTKFTEIQSTRVFKFNKARYKLTYLQGETFENFIRGKGFNFQRYDQSRLTSNITYIITRKKQFP